MLVFSGGIPVDMIDGDNVTVVDGHEMITLQLTSGVRAMHILEVAQSDMDSGMVDTAGSSEPLSTTSEHYLKLYVLMSCYGYSEKSSAVAIGTRSIVH